MFPLVNPDYQAGLLAALRSAHPEPVAHRLLVHADDRDSGVFDILTAVPPFIEKVLVNCLPTLLPSTTNFELPAIAPQLRRIPFANDTY
jgi:hypothetical protein